MMKRIFMILVILASTITSSFSQELFEQSTFDGFGYSFAAIRTTQDLYLVGNSDEYIDCNGVKQSAMAFIPPQTGFTQWADFNNDNYLDALLYTHTAEGPYCELFWRDQGVELKSIESGIRGLSLNSLCDNPFIDYNNDGFKDLFLSGVDLDLDHHGILYKNLGDHTFEESGLSFIGFDDGYAEWGNANNDGYPDLLVKGADINGNYRSTLYINREGETFTPFYAFISYDGPVKWGDYDADGDFDLLYSNSYYGSLSILENEQGGIAPTDIFIDTMSMYSCMWADLNNDGLLDVIAFGYKHNKGKDVLNVYLNDGEHNFVNSFQAILPDYTPAKSFISVGDCDNDGDLDFLFQSLGRNVMYFKNNTDVQNEIPSVPSVLSAKRASSGMVLSWDPSWDKETQQKSLTYNVRIGSSPGEYDIMAPHSQIGTHFGMNGYITKPGYGNASSDTFKIISDLEPGTYYWSVQAVDNIFAGSEFSEEQSFTYLPAFSKNDTLVPKLIQSNIEFLDYDLDGDYDYFLTGRPNYSEGITYLIRNNNDSTFDTLPIYFEDTWDANISIGDFNNDNYPDIFTIGSTHDKKTIACIYRNDGDTFTQVKRVQHTGVSEHSYGCWGDFDNDGDQDVYYSHYATHMVLLNNGNGSFTEVSILNPKLIGTNLVFDYDNDADLDIFQSNGYANSSFIYRNEGKLEFTRIDSAYIGFMNAKANVADYNDDGFLDFVLAGIDSSRFRSTHVFQNLRNGKFRELDHDIRYVEYGEANWGDIDNDNDADLLIAGRSASDALRLYENKAQNNLIELFSEVYANDIAYYAVLGDYNNDGNLDLVRNGILYSNNLEAEKEIPLAPENLSSRFFGFDVVLTWEAVETDLNHDKFSYNVRIGTSPGTADIVSPLSDLESGKRRVFSLGNAQLCRHFKITGLEPSTTYYWSVQAVDKAYAGGKWAPERSFTTPSLVANFGVVSACAGEVISFNDQSESPTDEITGWEWDLGDGNSSNNQNIEYVYDTAGTYKVSLTVNTNSLDQTVTREIVVHPTPEADFDYEVISIGQHTPFMNLTETNNATIQSWLWDFGDGETSILEEPEYHKYDTIGTYTAKLTVVSDQGCTSTATKDVSVCQQALDEPEMYVYGPVVWYMASSNDSANYYKWYLDGNEIAGSDEYIHVANQTTGTYRVAISVDNLCFTESDEITIPYLKSLKGSVPPSMEQQAPDSHDIFENLRIYPNPTSGTFTVEMDNSLRGDLDIDVINSGAVKVLQMSIEKTSDHFKTMIDLSGQGKGLYIIELSILDHQTARRLVVE